LSAIGLGVIADRLVAKEKVLVCFLDQSEVRFLWAEVRSRKPLGFGWFLLGLDVWEIVEKDEYPELHEFAESLVS
jgi:hypothetical protein